MSSIQSNIDQFKAMKHNPDNEPVVMLNLLKFKPEGGYESYMQYLKAANQYVEAVGGKLIYLGKPNELLNGSEIWDMMMLVQYPSRAKFLQMTNDPEYLKIHEHREQALERAVLYATDRISFSKLFASIDSDDK